MDGPYKHTRSSVSGGKTSQEENQVGNDDCDIFATPGLKDKNKRKLKTPAKSGKGEKSRTPSGQVLSRSVVDIRAFFAAEEQECHTPLSRKLSNSDSQLCQSPTNACEQDNANSHSRGGRVGSWSGDQDLSSLGWKVRNLAQLTKLIAGGNVHGSA